MDEGKVYLTGGGCGDAGLVSWKALTVLQSCDTVVYDSLVSEELLEWTRPDCERIYVGKRYGSHALRQSAINDLLVEKAREGKTVVRLKGGDPYVFGRGGEEFMALRGEGVCCEEIPGITSAIAVPAAAGIPVTHRGLADSVTVVTGTAADKDGHAGLNMDFETLARLRGTLVILMGMCHLAEIVTGLLAAGKDGNTPCAVIMEGTTGRQRVLRAALSELPARAAKQKFTSPAVIVIGAVAKLELLMDYAPRMEVTVGVTGTPHFADRLSYVLRRRGIFPWDMSFMEIRPAKDPLPDFTLYDWLVFTSPNGVKVFLEKMRQERRDLRTLTAKKIAVIGPGTAAVFEEAGLYAEYMPEVYDAAHLARGLADRIQARQTDVSSGNGEGRISKGGEENRKVRLTQSAVILLRASQGSDVLPLTLKERGIPYREYPIYELGVQEAKRDAVVGKEPDYIVFGSAMGVRAYFEGLKKKGLSNEKSRYVCIGEWCAREVLKYGETQPLIAEEAGVDAVAECLCREIEESRRQ